MLPCCYDEAVLGLYKRAIRSIVDRYPEMARDYVHAYYEMFDADKYEKHTILL